jgi:hypothetical protein
LTTIAHESLENPLARTQAYKTSLYSKGILISPATLRSVDGFSYTLV